MIYGGGTFNATDLINAIAKARKCESDPFSLHILKDNILHIYFQTLKTLIYALNEGPWCFDNELRILKPWNPNSYDPPTIFYSTHFLYGISNLPSWYYTPEIGKR